MEKRKRDKTFKAISSIKNYPLNRLPRPILLVMTVV